MRIVRAILLTGLLMMASGISPLSASAAGAYSHLEPSFPPPLLSADSIGHIAIPSFSAALSIRAELDGSLLAPPEVLLLPPSVGSSRTLQKGSSASTGIVRTKARPVTIPLPGRTITARLDRVEVRSQSGHTWYGRIDGEALGSAVFTTVAGHTVGYVEAGTRSYSIEEDNGGHRITENLSGTMTTPDKGPVLPGSIKAAKKSIGATATAGDPAIMPSSRRTIAPPEDGSKITLLILYTQQMATQYGAGIGAKTQQLVDLTNNAYQNSGIATRIELTDSRLFTATASEAYDIDTALTQVTNSATVAALRDEERADLVALVRRYDGSAASCGLAYLMQLPNHDFEPYGYSITEVRSAAEASPGYCSSLTLAHELGHNLGSAHDRDHATYSGAYPYSYGHVISGQFKTIMSYGDLPQISYFSTPLIKYLNTDYTLGIQHPSADSADNVRSINLTASTVANFRVSLAQPDIQVSPTSASFGFAKSGSPAAAKSITVSNVGDGALAVNGVAISGSATADYAVSAEDCTGGPIAAGASCTVSVVFNPTQVGTRSASVAISSNDADEVQTSVALTGVGATAGTDPVTALALNQIPDGANGWLRKATRISLSAAPAASIYYRWDTPDSGIWSIYAGSPIDVLSGSHTLYYRAVGTAGGLEASRSRSFKLDAVLPTNPTKLTSSHGVGFYSRDRTVTVQWSGASDGISGVDGFSFAFDHLESTIPNTSREVSELATSTESSTLKDGRWYFHIRTRDNAGNWQGALHHGPFIIDKTRPRTYAPRKSSAKRNGLARIVYRVKDVGTNKAYTVIRVKNAKGRVVRTLRPGWETPGVNHSVKFHVALPRGKYRFYVYAKDRARNTQANVASNTLKVK